MSDHHDAILPSWASDAHSYTDLLVSEYHKRRARLVGTPPPPAPKPAPARPAPIAAPAPEPPRPPEPPPAPDYFKLGIPRWRAVQLAVAHEFSLRRDDLTGSVRAARIVLARHVAMHVCREGLGMSLPHVGRMFGGRDHTTVLHASLKVQAMAAKDDAFRELVDRLVWRARDAGRPATPAAPVEGVG